jgi:hypothetical protein
MIVFLLLSCELSVKEGYSFVNTCLAVDHIHRIVVALVRLTRTQMQEPLPQLDSSVSLTSLKV